MITPKDVGKEIRGKLFYGTFTWYSAIQWANPVSGERERLGFQEHQKKRYARYAYQSCSQSAASRDQAA